MGFCTLQGPQRLSGGSNKLSFLHRLGCEFYKIVVLEPLNKISKSINFNSGPTVHYQPHTRNYSQFPCTTHLLKTTSISCSYTPLTSTTHLKSDNYLQLLNSTPHYVANNNTNHSSLISASHIWLQSTTTHLISDDNVQLFNTIHYYQPLPSK